MAEKTGENGGGGAPAASDTGAKRVHQDAPKGSSADTIIRAHEVNRQIKKEVEESLEEKHPLSRAFERRRKLKEKLRRAPMSKRVSRTEGRAPRVGTEALREEITDRETVENAFYSAFNLLEEDYQNNNLTPEERWAYESIKAAKEKTIDKEKSAFTNSFKNLESETGETFTQEEGIPIERLLEFLGKKMEALPADSTQRERLLRLGHILYINSQPFTLLSHSMEPSRLLGRVRQEAYFISKDVRATGSDFDNWLKAERALMARLELVLPPQEAQPAVAPTPEEAAREIRPEVAPPARAEVAPAPEPAAEPAAGPAEATPAAAPAAEAKPAAGEPQPQTIEQIRRELTIANRTVDIEKRARELAELQLREEMRRGSGWNPFNWPRKIGLRLAEDYYRQLYTERARQAMLAANNSYLTMDVVRNAAVNATHGAAEAQAAGKAKVEQVKTGVSLEGQQAIEVAGELKNAILSEIIRPVIKGQVTTEAQAQQKLREFVQSHQNDPQVQAVFGKDTSLYGRLAEYFATDLLEMGKLVREDIAAHKYSDEQLSEFTKIRIANASWAAETQASFNRWSDRAVRWAQQGRIRGAILNPATVGALASVTTFLALRAPGGVARTIAPFAAPGVGVLAGAAFAAFRRNYDLKVDRAAHQAERTYNLQIPQGAPRREALERFTYNTASVNELIIGGSQELLTGTTRKSLTELLRTDLSDGQVTNRANVLRRIAEIKSRLDFSSREKVDLVTFAGREQVEQGRLALVKAIVETRQALRTAGMSDAEISQLETNFTGEWNSKFTQNREQQDRSFAHYRLRNAAGAAVFGGAAGLAGGFVSQEGFAQIARHFPEAANIPVIGGFFQKGETLREQLMREHGLKTPGIPQAPTAPPTPTTETPVETVETTNVLSGPKTGVEANDITGHRTFIPKGTEWVRDPTDSNKWDLRVLGKPDKILIDNALFDSSGKLVDWNHATSQNSLFKVENAPQGTEIIKGDQAVSEWEKLKTPVHHREWYAYDKPGAQGNELRLYTAKDGDTVVLDMSKMEQGFQKGLTPNPIDVQEIIKTQKSGFMFSIPGPDEKLISVWVPDGADGVWDGKLRLDPNDMTHFVEFNGKKIPLGEFSRMVLNQDAVKPLSNGDIATELYNRQDVFKLGANGKMGFIEAGTLVDRPEGKVLQAFATIRGNGGVQVELSKGFVAEVTLKGSWVEEIKKLVPAPEAPQPQPIEVEGEAPPIIPIPFAPRHPLEPLGKPGETPQAPARREPEREVPLRAEQATAKPALSDRLATAKNELAGLKQGLAAAGVEPNLEQKAKLEQLQAEVERLQQETAAPTPPPAPAPAQPPSTPQPPAAVGPAAPAPGPTPTLGKPFEATAQVAQGDLEQKNLRARIVEEKERFEQLNGAPGIIVSNPYTTLSHMLWQEVAYGSPRTKNSDNCFRGYLMVEPEDMETALSFLRYWGRERKIVGKRTDFKWLLASSDAVKSEPDDTNVYGRYEKLEPTDGRIVIYGDTPDEIQEILASLVTFPKWQDIEQRRVANFGAGPEGAPRKPGTNSFIDKDGREWRSLNYNDKPGYSENEAADPDWRAMKKGAKTILAAQPVTATEAPPQPPPPSPQPPPAAAEPTQAQAATPPPAPVIEPLEDTVTAAPIAPIEIPAQPTDLLGQVNEVLKTSTQSLVRFETIPASLADYIKTISLPAGARIKEATAQITNGNLQISGVTATPLGDANFSAILGNDPAGGIKVITHTLNLPLLARGFRGQIESYITNINQLISGQINSHIDPAWEAVNFQIEENKITFEFRKKEVAPAAQPSPAAPQPPPAAPAAEAPAELAPPAGEPETAPPAEDVEDEEAAAAAPPADEPAARPTPTPPAAETIEGGVATASTPPPAPAQPQPPSQPPKATFGQRFAGIFGRKRTQLPPAEPVIAPPPSAPHATAAEAATPPPVPAGPAPAGPTLPPPAKNLEGELAAARNELVKTLEDRVAAAAAPAPQAEVAAEAPLVEPAPPSPPAKPPVEREILEATQPIVQPQIPTPMPARGEPLTPETAQRIRKRIAGIQTEKDFEQQSLIETLSQSLQTDSQQSPQPLKVEATKALITEELLKLGEEDLLNLLQKYNGLRESLVMLRDRDIPNIRNASIILKALRSQANAQEILKILEQKQPPEFLSTRSKPPAQAPTVPLLTEKELEALERARADIRTMGIPPPPSVVELLEDTVATAATPPQTEKTIADQASSDQLTAARDELAGFQQGLAAARRDGIAPSLEQKAKLERLQAEVARLQRKVIPPTSAELESFQSQFPRAESAPAEGSTTEAPALPSYVEAAGKNSV